MCLEIFKGIQNNVMKCLKIQGEFKRLRDQLNKNFLKFIKNAELGRIE